MEIEEKQKIYDKAFAAVESLSLTNTPEQAFMYATMLCGIIPAVCTNGSLSEDVMDNIITNIRAAYAMTIEEMDKLKEDKV